MRRDSAVTAQKVYRGVIARLAELFARNAAGSRVRRTARAFRSSRSFAQTKLSTSHVPTNPVPPVMKMFRPRRASQTLRVWLRT